MGRNYDVMSFISKYIYLKEPWSSQFHWHRQTVIKMIKATSEDSIKVKRVRNYVLKCNFYEKILMSAKGKYLEMFRL